MQGYNFPWSDFHELNFDWLMKKFKFLSSKIEKIPTKVSQLVNDLGFVNALQASAAAPVQSVNGMTGNVVIPDEIYRCIYGTTTNNEIEQAIADGLLICCEYNDRYYLLTNRDSATKHIFNIIENTSTGPHSYWLTCDTDTWSNSSMLLAKNASPALTGTPTAPTAAAGDSSTQIATTAFVQGELDDYAPLNDPALTGTPTAPTATAGDSSTQIATTAFVQGEISGFVDAAGAAAAAPVQSVNSQTGAVVLGASDVGAIPAGTGILVEAVTGGSQSISANTTETWTINVSKTGYTPLGIVAIYKPMTGSAYTVPYSWSLNGNIASVSLRNIHNSNSYTIQPTVDILYLKN